MKILITHFLLCLGMVSQLVAADSEDEAVLRLLTDRPIRTSREVKAVPLCVTRGLRRWYERPFILANKPEAFPRLTDIRRAGDGRFCLLFFGQLERGTYVLSFKDYASIGIANRALVFRSDGKRCVVFADYAFPNAVTSLPDLRGAIRRMRQQ